MPDITLVGGGRDPEAQRECLRPFLAAVSARSADPAVGFAWVDEGDGTDWSERSRGALEWLGSFRAVDLRAPVGSTLDPAALRDLDGLVVCSGLTPAYASALAPAAAALRALVLEGGVPYAGVSAGAAVAASAAVVGGYLDRGRVVCPPDAGEDLDEVTVVPGLGLVAETVDVHAAAWGTLPRLAAALAVAGVPTGLAVDEDTAWHVTGTGTEVLGRHAVHRLTRDGADVRWEVLRPG